MINIDATDAEWTLALEQFLIFALVLAKWIAPKNGVTNQQLSQLLLVNIAAGADILELMETFNEDKVAHVVYHALHQSLHTGGMRVVLLKL